MRDNQEGFKKAAFILKYLKNELNDEQEQEFFKWMEEDLENKFFFDKIINEESLKTELSFFSLSNKAAAWDEFRQRVEPGKVLSLWSRFPILKYVAVAAAMLVASFYIFYSRAVKQSDLITSTYKNDVKSGGNKAVLTLADGRQISLDEAANGKLAQQDNFTISKTSAGQIVYSGKNIKEKLAGTDRNLYNTIATPKGGDYMLILPDGTKVWLNAASSLCFPVSFAAKERKVVLKGEAYFEVYKNKKAPFIVMTDEVEVSVLGTHFNIMAYPDESGIRTTLLEGSVRVSKNNGESVVLKPGQQATVIDDIEVSPANSEATAWKDGFTSFKDADLETIMRSVSRWYDIEVKYQGPLKQKLFTGVVSRGANLSEVLNSLQYLGGVHFKIEGRVVTISQK